MTSGESSEETFDPDKAVVLSEQKTEDFSGGAATAGAPGTASNLPRPVSRPAGSGTTTQRKTESTNYQASRVIRRMKLPQGTLKRVSLSVLLDQPVRWEGVGAKAKRIFETPSPEKIKTIKDVLSAAIGLVPDRGDVVIIESLAFDATLRSGPPPAPTPPAPPKPIIEIPPFLLGVLPPPLKDRICFWPRLSVWGWWCCSWAWRCSGSCGGRRKRSVWPKGVSSSLVRTGRRCRPPSRGWPQL